jgi:hypothetical protein
MIDYSNEIFNAVATDLRGAFEGIRIMGEYVATPASFPCVSLDEIRNIPMHLDSAVQNKYAQVDYRAQVFCNLNGGKRAKAREIYARLDEKMQSLGLSCVTYTTTPEIYNSEVYCITATYRGVVDRNGVFYRG